MVLGRSFLWGIICPDVSDTPFPDGPDHLTDVLNQSGVGIYDFTGQAGIPSTITMNAGQQGRYVWVQLKDSNYMEIAEAQVFGPNSCSQSASSASSRFGKSNLGVNNVNNPCIVATATASPPVAENKDFFVSCHNDQVMGNAQGQEGLTLRATAGLSGSSLGLVPPGTQLHAIQYIVADGYRWHQVTNPAGWVAEGNITNAAITGPLKLPESVVAPFLVTTADCPTSTPLVPVAQGISGFSLTSSVSSSSGLATNLLLENLASNLLVTPTVQVVIKACGYQGWTITTVISAGGYPAGITSIWTNSLLRLRTNLNSCGAAVLSKAISDVQNQFDAVILAEATAEGVKPWVLKGLLIEETEMYPSPQPHGGIFGIAQIQDITIQQHLGDLLTLTGLPSTTSLSTFITLLDGLCAPGTGDCDANGISRSEVERSIKVSAWLLQNFQKVQLEQLNFQQANDHLTCTYINAQLQNSPRDPIYTQEQPACLTPAQADKLTTAWNTLNEDDKWKLTLASYNAGPYTVVIAAMNAARATADVNPVDISWNNVKGYIPEGPIKNQVVPYVDDISSGHPRLHLLP